MFILDNKKALITIICLHSFLPIMSEGMKFQHGELYHDWHYSANPPKYKGKCHECGEMVNTAPYFWLKFEGKSHIAHMECLTNAYDPQKKLEVASTATPSPPSSAPSLATSSTSEDWWRSKAQELIYNIDRIAWHMEERNKMLKQRLENDKI